MSKPPIEEENLELKRQLMNSINRLAKIQQELNRLKEQKQKLLTELNQNGKKPNL